MAIIRQIQQYDNGTWIPHDVGSIDTLINLSQPGYYESATAASTVDWNNNNLGQEIKDIETLLKYSVNTSKNNDTKISNLQTTVESLSTAISNAGAAIKVTSIETDSTKNLKNLIAVGDTLATVAGKINALKKNPIKIIQKRWTNMYIPSNSLGAINGGSASTASGMYKDAANKKPITALTITSTTPILGISSIQLTKGTSATNSTSWGQVCINRQNLNIVGNGSTAYLTLAVKNFNTSKMSCNDIVLNYFVANY